MRDSLVSFAGLSRNAEERYVTPLITTLYVCPLITLTRSPKAELRPNAYAGCRQTVMNDPGAQQPGQMFLTRVNARPQHRELRALLLTNSVSVL